MTLAPNGYIFGLVTDQRKSQRFDMKLTMQVVRCGAQPLEEFAQTANVSSNGVLFYSDIKPEVGQPVEYVLTLAPEIGKRPPVKLHCMGKVVRYEEDFTLTAATLERYEFLRN